jgi:hypothetical protein
MEILIFEIIILKIRGRNMIGGEEINGLIKCLNLRLSKERNKSFLAIKIDKKIKIIITTFIF